jgi:GAF domain-containing protein
VEDGRIVERLSEVLAEVTRTMFSAETLHEVLAAVVEAAPRAVEGCEGSGIVFVLGDALHVPVATSDQIRRLEQLEIEVGTGPCLEALREHAIVEAPDLEHEDRWREWSEAATDSGMRSMLGYRLFAAGDSLGALDLYSSRVDAFDDDARAAGLALAAHAAIAVANVLRGIESAETIEHLENALAGRDVIGQAKGILMVRHRLTADEAFARLVAASQSRNVKLRDIARHVAETGELLA